MNPGIRSAAAGNAGFVVGHDGQGFLDAALYRGFLALELPAQKFTSIVLEPNGVTLHRAAGRPVTE
jgi:hypothetical protein